jgi:hypothetical protein
LLYDQRRSVTGERLEPGGPRLGGDEAGIAHGGLAVALHTIVEIDRDLEQFAKLGIEVP